MRGLPLTRLKQAGLLQRVHVICRYSIVYGGLFGLVTIILNIAVKVFPPDMWYFYSNDQMYSQGPMPMESLVKASTLAFDALGLVMLIILTVRASMFVTRKTRHFGDGAVAGLLTGIAGYLIGVAGTFIVYYMAWKPILSPDIDISTFLQQRVGNADTSVLLVELAVVAVCGLVGSFLGKNPS